MREKLSFVLLFCVAAFVFSVGSASAQIRQGALLAGGGLNLGFNSQKVEKPINSNTIQITESRSTSFTFNPKVGYFFTNALAVGLDMNINSTANKDNNGNTTSKSSYYTVGAFARYYFPPKIFLEGGLGVGKQTVNGDDKNNIFTYSIGAGYAAFINDHVALEPTVKWVGTNYTNVNDSRYKTMNGNFQIGLALQIYF